MNRCAHCRGSFVPNPRAKAQRLCAKKPCQRARKTQWQRAKMATDPDYHANQRDAQRAWQRQHPDYWRQYRRQRRPDSRERNRLLQTHRDHARRAPALAKMDASVPLTRIQPGLYT